MLQKFVLIVALMLATGAHAQTAAERVVVDTPWVRLNAPGTRVTGAFMTLKNTGDKPISLVRGESPVAATTELHNHFNEGGVMKMRQIPSISLPIGGAVQLKPGSLHLMLIELKAPLQEGDSVSLRLGFDDGSSKQIEARVRKPGHEGHMH